METLNLHKQKIQILGRLIKESSLSLEEALLLLQDKEEQEQEVVKQPALQYTPSTGTYTPWPYGGSGVITVPLNGSFGMATTTSTNILNTTATDSGTSLTNSTTAVVLKELEKVIEDASL